MSTPAEGREQVAPAAYSGEVRKVPPLVLDSDGRILICSIFEKRSTKSMMRPFGTTDTDVVHLAEFEYLRRLRLFDADITDETLKLVADLKYLKLLDLCGAKAITDAGIAELAGLHKLEKLGLSETSVTDAGVKKLQRALPDCVIYQHTCIQ
ncbi:MAG: hypothetical protein JKY37_20815 [Nannocystaceae bacterium]|nr:hypothetical protein [Nannocystaceae bacterium]